MNAKYREESLMDKMMGLSNEGHEILNFFCKDNETSKEKKLSRGRQVLT
jgi:hypothetical protein